MDILKIAQSSIVATAMITGGNMNASAQQGTQKFSPAELVDALHTAFGNHHARAVHAKGIIFEGMFTPNAAASTLTKAPHLQQQSSSVMVRFSDFTGIPDIPDNIGAANPRGLAIKFTLPDGSTTDIVAHSFNGFPTANSDQFRELLLSIGASGPDAARPTRLDTFLDNHPVAKTFLTTQHTPVSYATISYFGINAFRFTNNQNISHYIRYRFIPEEGEKYLSEELLKMQGPDFLIQEISSHVAAGPVKFRLVAQIAEDGDPIENPSIAWPDSRKEVLLGVITIQKIAFNTSEADKGLSFMPNNIPDGIQTADPMLDFRSKAYPISVKERQ